MAIVAPFLIGAAAGGAGTWVYLWLQQKRATEGQATTPAHSPAQMDTQPEEQVEHDAVETAALPAD